MIIGTNLKTILNSNKNNVVAKKLLELESDKPSWISDIDYIDIALENKAKISFISKDRINRFITEIKHIPVGRKKISLKNTSIYKYQQQGFGEIVSVDPECILTDTLPYIIKWSLYDNRNSYNASDIRYHKQLATAISIVDKTYDESLRKKFAYMTSPGKFINKLNLGFSDKDVYDFLSIFLQESALLINEGLEFRVVKGDLIPFYYHEDQYAENKGNLGSSCMRYDNCESFLKIYAKYPDKIKMLILVNTDNKIEGRAVVWNCLDESTDKQITFMDRIYVTNHNYEFFFKYYAESKGWWYKSEQSYSNKSEFKTPKNKYNCSCEKLSIILEDASEEYFPYLDTLSYGDVSGSDVHLYNFGFREYDFTSTEGGPLLDEVEDTVWSEYYEEDISRDDSVYSDYLSSYIRNYAAVEVIIDSRGNASIMSEDHEDICGIDGSFYLTELCIWSEYYGEYIHEDIDQIIAVDGGNDYVYSRDAVFSEYDQEDYLKEDCVYSEYDKSWILESDSVEDDVEGIVHQDSLDTILAEREEQTVEEYETT